MNARQKRLFEEARKRNPNLQIPTETQLPSELTEDDLALIKQGVGDKSSRPAAEAADASGEAPAGEQSGSVVTYFEAKGFGFLRPDDGGRDIFFHVSRLAEGLATDLRPGTRVLYELGMDRTGDPGPTRDSLLDFTDCRYVPKSYYDALDAIRRPAPGMFLYTLVGSYGKALLVEDRRPFCVQRHIGILRSSTQLDPKFITRLLQSELVFSQATQCATGPDYRQRLPLDVCGRMMAYVPPLAEGSLRMAMEGASVAQGPPPAWFQRASDIRFVGYEHQGDDTLIALQIPTIGEAAEELYQQRELWDTRPDPAETAFDVLRHVVGEVASENNESSWYDR